MLYRVSFKPQKIKACTLEERKIAGSVKDIEWHWYEGILSRISQAKKTQMFQLKLYMYVSVRDMGHIAMMGMFRRLTNQNCYQ